MSEIYLIRHGQASFGAKEYDKLSEKGLVQSKILGHHLVALKIKFDAIYSGEMERQKKTAESIINVYREKGFLITEPLIEKAFNEYDATAVWDAQVSMMQKDNSKLLDMLKKDPFNKKAFQDIFSKVLDRWISGQFDIPGVVTWKGFKKQVALGLNSLIKTQGASKKIAVFSSGGTICAAVQMALDLSDAKTMDLSWQVMNASVTRIKYNGSKISLSGFNDITHLELTGDKTFLTYR